MSNSFKGLRLFVALTMAVAGNVLLTGAAPGASAAVQASSILLDKGIAELESKRYAEAIKLFEQAVTANPHNARAFSYLGRSYQEVGDKDRAYKYYDIAMSIDPGELKALSWSGEIDAEDGELNLAGEKLAKLERLCGVGCPEYVSLKAALDASAAQRKSR